MSGRGQSVPVGGSGSAKTNLYIYLPGYIGAVATDILSTWFRQTGEFTLTGAKVHINIRLAAGGTAPTWDLMRSTNNGSSFTSLLPSGNSNKIVLPVGQLVADITDRNWQNPTIDDGDLLRLDLLVTDDFSGQDVQIVIEPA